MRDLVIVLFALCCFVIIERIFARRRMSKFERWVDNWTTPFVLVATFVFVLLVVYISN